MTSVGCLLYDDRSKTWNIHNLRLMPTGESTESTLGWKLLKYPLKNSTTTLDGKFGTNFKSKHLKKKTPEIFE